MNPLIRLLPLIALVLAPFATASDATLDAVRRADDARGTAEIAPNRATLDAIFSDDLSYAHASGHLDNKASYMRTLLDGSTRYYSIDYHERHFKQVAPNIVLEIGSCHIKSANNGVPVDIELHFLSAWRLERGAWRFLAWQSCKVKPPAAPKS